MRSTPAGLRLRIGLLGRRNAGKSALLNALAGRECSLVNEQPGTTTDPVIKAMEWRPLGPVQLIDTAGLDDTGELGGERVRRTRQILPRLDLALLAVLATFLALVNAFAMTPPAYVLEAEIAAVLGTQREAIVLGLIFLVGAILLPLALVYGAAAVSRRSSRSGVPTSS